MFTIGEFSKATGLTVKTLRFYQEEGLLAPAFVDPQTGYRHYDDSQIEAARTIAYLRGLEFPLADIKEILRHAGDDEEGILHALERHKAAIEQKVRRLRKVARSLDQFISEERQAGTMAQAAHEVQEKVLDPVLVGGIRMKGRYSDCGQGFGRLGRSLGRFICGKPFLLHYDTEYKEDDADFEACFPIRQSKAVDGVSVRELPGGRCLSLLQKGPYDQLGRAYARILKHVKEKGYSVVMPTREVYLKGPGMIFKGNPKNYLTEIQIPVEPNGAPSAAGDA
jgi:DNA-binding transcriptional MerR regulator/effector-binding domain-containing protein